MKTLIIYAHPGSKGHCYHILKRVEQSLKNKKRKYEIIDLYKINYDPILKNKEHYTSGNREISKENLKIQKKIKETKKLIFIFPVWWNSMPAILKGFFDKILTPRFAFKYEKILGKNMPMGLLKGKKALILITSGGSNFISRVLFGNRVNKVIKYDILKFCGINSKVIRLGDSTKPIDNQILKKISKNVKKGLRWLF